MAGAEGILKWRGERTIVLDHYRTIERKCQEPTDAEGGDIKRLDEKNAGNPQDKTDRLDTELSSNPGSCANILMLQKAHNSKFISSKCSLPNK
jgi:hypothetical protein